MLGLKFFLITITVLAASVSGFIELHLGGLAVELNIARLTLTNHNRGLEMDVDEDNQFVSTRLEEEMLHVAEEHVHVLTAER